MAISILIAEDDPLLRELLTAVLLTHPDFQVLGGLGDGQQVLQEVVRLRPQILLLDLALPGSTGLQILDRLDRIENTPRILVVSGSETEETQLLAARHGAHGFIPKTEATRVIPEAIRKVAGGGWWFDPKVTDAILNDYRALARRERERESPFAQLSGKEREVLGCVARGLTNPQIAAELFMSVSSVKAHLRKILETLGVQSRTEAAIFAVREGLLDAADVE